MCRNIQRTIHAPTFVLTAVVTAWLLLYTIGERRFTVSADSVCQCNSKVRENFFLIFFLTHFENFYAQFFCSQLVITRESTGLDELNMVYRCLLIFSPVSPLFQASRFQHREAAADEGRIASVLNREPTAQSNTPTTADNNDLGLCECRRFDFWRLHRSRMVVASSASEETITELAAIVGKWHTRMMLSRLGSPCKCFYTGWLRGGFMKLFIPWDE